MGNDPRALLVRHQYVFALLWNARYREAAAMQQETNIIAEIVADSRSKAYSLTTGLADYAEICEGDARQTLRRSFALGAMS